MLRCHTQCDAIGGEAFRTRSGHGASAFLYKALGTLLLCGYAARRCHLGSRVSLRQLLILWHLGPGLLSLHICERHILLRVRHPDSGTLLQHQGQNNIQVHLAASRGGQNDSLAEPHPSLRSPLGIWCKHFCITGGTQESEKGNCIVS